MIIILWTIYIFKNVIDTYHIIMLESFSRCSRWILEKATIIWILHICFRFYSLCWIDRTKSAPLSPACPSTILSTSPQWRLILDGYFVISIINVVIFEWIKLFICLWFQRYHKFYTSTWYNDRWYGDVV